MLPPQELRLSPLVSETCWILESTPPWHLKTTTPHPPRRLPRGSSSPTKNRAVNESNSARPPPPWQRPVTPPPRRPLSLATVAMNQIDATKLVLHRMPAGRLFIESSSSKNLPWCTELAGRSRTSHTTVDQIVASPIARAARAETQVYNYVADGFPARNRASLHTRKSDGWGPGIFHSLS